MLLAALPQRYANWMGAGWSTQVEVNADGTAKYVPPGLRVVEACSSAGSRRTILPSATPNNGIGS